MKNLILTNTILIFLTLPALSDDWLLISQLFNGNKIYVDPSEIVYTPDFIDAPVKQIFANAMTTQSGILATGYTTTARVNCKYKKIGFSGVKAFDLEGKVFYSSNDYDFRPKNVAEHSAGDNIIDYLCDKNFKDNIQQRILQE